jgi:hypothetical protein
MEPVHQRDGRIRTQARGKSKNENGEEVKCGDRFTFLKKWMETQWIVLNFLATVQLANR